MPIGTDSEIDILTINLRVPIWLTQYVLNQHTSAQLRWMNNEWVMSIDGHYGPGFWRLEL